MNGSTASDPAHTASAGHSPALYAREDVKELLVGKGHVIAATGHGPGAATAFVRTL